MIFQESYATGEVPSLWKTANIFPVYTKGKKFDPINYRPISLSCISCKLMEHIVASHIMTHASNFDILNPFQHGFRRGLSCETQLIEFINDITINTDAGRQTDCLIMDFSKAFKKVNHSLLIHKLEHYGIRGKTNQWNFLGNRSQSVVVEDETSTKIPVDSGVPKSSVLGLSLFLFYINDLPEGIASSVRLFADDTIMYLTVSNNTDVEKLQHDLDQLSNWETKWHMEFHPAKCNVLMSIIKKRKPINHDYNLIINGHTLEHVTSAKYLGCTITS